MIQISGFDFSNMEVEVATPELPSNIMTNMELFRLAIKNNFCVVPDVYNKDITKVVPINDADHPIIFSKMSNKDIAKEMGWITTDA